MIRVQIGLVAFSTFTAIAMGVSAQTESTANMIQQSIGACLQSSQNITSSTADAAKSNCQKVINILDTIGKNSVRLEPIVFLSEGIANSTVVKVELIQSGNPINLSQCNSLQISHYAFYQLSLEAAPSGLNAPFADSAEIKKAKEMYDFSSPQRAQLITQKSTCRTLTGNSKWPSN